MALIARVRAHLVQAGGHAVGARHDADHHQRRDSQARGVRDRARHPDRRRAQVGWRAGRAPAGGPGRRLLRHLVARRSSLDDADVPASANRPARRLPWKLSPGSRARKARLRFSPETSRPGKSRAVAVACWGCYRAGSREAGRPRPGQRDRTGGSGPCKRHWTFRIVMIMHSGGACRMPSVVGRRSPSRGRDQGEPGLPLVTWVAPARVLSGACPLGVLSVRVTLPLDQRDRAKGCNGPAVLAVACRSLAPGPSGRGRRRPACPAAGSGGRSANACWHTLKHDRGDQDDQVLRQCSQG